MANFNFNKLILGGRLTADVEVKQTPNGVPVAQFSIAVNRKPSRDGQTQTDFFNCTAWRNTAEFVGKYFSKGSSICVIGSIQNRSWTDQNGQKRYATDIIVDEATFVDSKNGAEASTSAGGSNYIPEAYKTSPAQDFNDSDPDLPF